MWTRRPVSRASAEEIARRHGWRLRASRHSEWLDGIALAAQALAGVQARLVLAVKGDAAPHLREQRPQHRRIVDQQIAGGRSHEHLDRRGAFQHFEPRKIVDVVRRGAGIEGEIAMHAARRPRDLIGERLGGYGRRIGIRHVEHRRDAAQHGGAAAAFQVLAILAAGLAEMHMAVDDAGQDVQARARRNMSPAASRANVAEPRDPPIT